MLRQNIANRVKFTKIDSFVAVLRGASKGVVKNQHVIISALIITCWFLTTPFEAPLKTATKLSILVNLTRFAIFWRSIYYSDFFKPWIVYSDKEYVILTTICIFRQRSWHSDKMYDIPTNALTFRQISWHSDKYPDIPTTILTFRQLSWHSDRVPDIPTNSVTFRQNLGYSEKFRRVLWHSDWNLTFWHRILTFWQKHWHSDKKLDIPTKSRPSNNFRKF